MISAKITILGKYVKFPLYVMCRFAIMLCARFAIRLYGVFSNQSVLLIMYGTLLI